MKEDRAAARKRGLMTGKQALPDFLDPAHEWRRMFAEAWGTFLLVLVAAGGGVVADASGGAVTPAMRAVAPGLVVIAVIYFMGEVSGAEPCTPPPNIIWSGLSPPPCGPTGITGSFGLLGSHSWLLLLAQGTG